MQQNLEKHNDVHLENKLIFSLCLSYSCVEEILKADPGQLHAKDSAYGGTPLHWCKTAEVIIQYIMCLVIRNPY